MFEKKSRILKWVAAEISSNPITRKNRLSAWCRFVCWQFKKRFCRTAIVMRFLGRSKLVLPSHGEGGAWINAVVGLDEFSDLGFVLHGLRGTDFFIDAGANVGVYTVVAAGEVRAHACSFEPSSPQYTVLVENLRQNDIEDRVDARCVAVGECEKQVVITTGQGSLNHIVESSAESDAGSDVVTVECVSLDSAVDMSGAREIMIKIDVEGYEHNVLKGAQKLFRTMNVFAALVETHGHGDRYNGGSDDIDRWFLENGYCWCDYDPITRELTSVKDGGGVSVMANRLYIKDLDFVLERVKTADSFVVNGRKF